MPEITRSAVNAIQFLPKGTAAATAAAKPGATNGLAITRRMAIKREGATTITLPTLPTEISHNFSDYSIVLHGEPAIGKTELAMFQPGVLNLTFDPPDKSMAWIQEHMTDWRKFLLYLGALEKAAEKGEYPYPRVVVDGAEIMARYCQNYVEDVELKVDHVSDAQWGKGPDRFSGEFAGAVDRLLALPGGCWFICHSEWKMRKTRSGTEVEKLCLLMKPKPEDQIVGKSKLIMAYTYSGRDRIIVVRGDETTSAGCKIKGHFFTPKGEPVVEVPMGKTAEEGWYNLQRAFNNEQTFTHVNPATRPGPNPNKLVSPMKKIVRTVAPQATVRAQTSPQSGKVGGTGIKFLPRR
jgi:hypothetical protein